MVAAQPIFGWVALIIHASALQFTSHLLRAFELMQHLSLFVASTNAPEMTPLHPTPYNARSFPRTFAETIRNRPALKLSE
jgi:hypothetical protein